MKIYVQLKDIGTTFYDGSTQTSIVGDRVAYVERSGRIGLAIQDGTLKHLSEAEGKALFTKQNPPVASEENLDASETPKQEHTEEEEETYEQDNHAPDSEATEPEPEEEEAPAKPVVKAAPIRTKKR